MSKSKPIYLDYASTTPVDERVAEKMLEYMTFNNNFGNAASRSHSFGWQADEAVELATELGIDIQEAEIIRTNSTGLVIYNPKNLAERIKGMKNTEKTREQKIAERVAYMQHQQNNSDNLN